MLATFTKRAPGLGSAVATAAGGVAVATQMPESLHISGIPCSLVLGAVANNLAPPSIRQALQPGVKFARHKHITPAEFFITKGVLKFERGEAGAGVYGYEEIGEIHEEAGGDEVTEFLYIGHGPVSYLDENDNTLFIGDLAFFKSAWEGEVPENIVD